MQVVYFAWVRERIGLPQEQIETSAATVNDLVAELREREERYAMAFADISALRVALDQELSEFDAPSSPETVRTISPEGRSRPAAPRVCTVSRVAAAPKANTLATDDIAYSFWQMASFRKKSDRDHLGSRIGTYPIG